MRLKDILETTRPAEDFADAIGLEAEGDGMWSDPHTGKVTHRIDHGRLTKVDPDGSSETNRLLRKLMKLSLIQLLLGESLTEEESEASKEAKAKGLEYKGFGRWTDPNTGQRYTSQDGKLVAADPNQISMNLGDPKIEPRKGEPGARRDRRGQAAKGPRAYQDTKKGDWWDDPGFDQKMMAKTAADRATKKADKDAEFKKDNEKWAGDRAKGAKLKRAQELRQSWKQKGHAEDQATYARDFPRLYALDVVSQQGKDLSANIAKGMKGPQGQDPQWRKDAAEEIKKHRERVEKIREMPQDTETSDEEGMDARRAMFDHLRQDGDDTVSGMKGKTPRIVRR